MADPQKPRLSPQVFFRHPFAVLLALQLTALVILPYMSARATLQEILLFAINLVLMTAAIYFSDHHKHELVLVSTLAVAIITLTLLRATPWLPAWTNDQSLYIVNVSLNVLFFGFATFKVLMYVLTPRDVSGNTLSAAALAYILLATFWNQVYNLIYLTVPHSFSHPNAPEALTWLDFLYFSIMTMTSTGYGDIVAVSDPARAIASLEALTGNFYMAILVARLVGVHSAKAVNELQLEEEKSQKPETIDYRIDPI